MEKTATETKERPDRKTGHCWQEFCVHIVNLTRKSSDRRTLVIVVPYAIRVKDQCCSRKWGGRKRGG